MSCTVIGWICVPPKFISWKPNGVRRLLGNWEEPSWMGCLPFEISGPFCNLKLRRGLSPNHVGTLISNLLPPVLWQAKSCCLLATQSVVFCFSILYGREFQKKTSISALLTMSKPLTVWITIHCGKFWERWEYQTTWPACWEICMQVRKQQLELDMEQQTGSK